MLRNLDDARVVDVGGIDEREEIIVERQKCSPSLRGVLEVLPIGRPEGLLLHRGGNRPVAATKSFDDGHPDVLVGVNRPHSSDSSSGRRPSLPAGVALWTAVPLELSSGHSGSK